MYNSIYKIKKYFRIKISNNSCKFYPNKNDSTFDTLTSSNIDRYLSSDTHFDVCLVINQIILNNKTKVCELDIKCIQMQPNK